MGYTIMGMALGIALIVLFIVGVPIAFAIGGASVIALIIDGSTPLILVAQRMFIGIDSFPYLALPFFILAGNLMGSGGISKRLVDFCMSLLGKLSGGLALVAVLTAMFFAAVSGSSAATTAAVGAILIPSMVRNHYKDSFAAATVSSASALGIIIPPSVPMILFCIGSGVSVGKIFAAGIIPGIFIGITLMFVAYFRSKQEGYRGTKEYSVKEILIAFKDALLALIMPLIILGGIYGGIFTPTEAAAVAVIYGFIVSMFIYREITYKDFAKIILDSTITSASILIIISAANLFGLLMARDMLPQRLAELFISISSDKYVFLLLINVMLLLVGMVFESSAAIIILTPLLCPIAVFFGIDLIHFGVIMIVNLAIGMITPPVGLNLFVASYISGVPLKNIMSQIWPFLIVFIADLLIITYLPQISLWLPSLLG